MPVPAKEGSPPEIPANWDRQRLVLADVLDIALRNNSAAKASWSDARAAAAGYGSAKAAYYPAVTFDSSLALKNTKDSNAGTETSQQSPGGALNLSWLLLDFGSRDAARDQAFQLLLDANWKHNTMLQDTILLVEKAYFQYMAAKSTLLARQADVQDGELHLAAAEALHEAGVATIADVLQMKTVLAQARLNLQTAQGDIFTTRGALAVAMGLSANMPFDIEDEPGPVDPEPTNRRVEELIDLALAKRPDLAAAQARYLASVAQARKVKAAGLPTLSLSGGAGRTWYEVNTDASNGPYDRREDVLTAGVLLRVPLFSGFAHTYDTRKAEAEVQGQAARNDTLAQQVVLQVFQAYYALQTAAGKVKIVEDLLASASQSAAVAAERYKEGVGTVLDLVAAQSALTAARVQQVEAGWQWRTALAQLAHDTGQLELEGTRPAIGSSPLKQQGKHIQDNP